MRLAAILAFLPCLADAQQIVCAPHDEMTALLKERWGETPQSIGISGTGMMVELYASEDSGTWSLLSTAPGGQTCLAASGHSWSAVKEPEGEGA